ncbi:general substrate transporter [Aspergillus cavernicola]|uniref:General substrate transporter n=1 Tax=Aspergillus cavernicola TaxID=176166 RepID=A0ABR4HZB2_9EURO
MRTGSLDKTDNADNLWESEQSKLYTQAQHDLGFWEAVRLYRPAVFWCLVINIAVILKGFDGALVGSIVGLDPFKKQFGYLYNGEYVVSAAWNGAFNYANSIGGVMGALFAGWVYDRVGPKVTLAICSVLSIAFIFMEFFAETPVVLFLGEVFNGTVIGFYPVIGSAYIGEVCPLVLRGVAGSMVNLGFVAGQLIASGVLKGTNSLDSKWAYKAPYAAQWVPPLLVLMFIIFCPNSPWWLCRRGRLPDAENALKRFATSEVDVAPTLANIKHTLRLEQQLEKHHNYLDCFRGPDLRRLIIAVMVYSIQPLSGQVLYVNYAVQFFERAGLDSSNAFSMNVGLTATGFVGTILAWPLLSLTGRRPIYILGTMAIAFLLLLIGILDVVPQSGSGPVWGQCSLIIVCLFIYDVTIGPACFTILCEIASVQLRGMTIGLATVACHIWNIIFAVSIPYAISQDQGDWKGKLGFLFSGIAVLCGVWCFFFLPETKDRTFEELDVLFEERVGSRAFEKYSFATGRGEDC